METRYEKKIYLSIENYNYFFSNIYLNKLAFSEINNERIVNSLYFDDVELTSYFDSIEGSNLRKKYRLRWYGQNMRKTKCHLEIKEKYNDLGSKKLFDIGYINMHSPLKRGLFKNIVRNLQNKNDFESYLLENYFPILYCSYKRKYFLSKNKLIRLTIDTNISYSNVSFFRSLSTTKAISYPFCVFEFKYSNNERSNKFFENNFFDAQITRFSKYTNGIELIFK